MTDRDLELNDDRRTCMPILGKGCQHYRVGWCNNPVKARLVVRVQSRAEVGPQLAATPQRCGGYVER